MNVSFRIPTRSLRKLCCVFLTLMSTAAAANEVTQLGEAFEKRRAAVTTQRDEQLAKLETSYLAALNRQLDRVKAGGKLEEVLTIRDEIEHVKDGKDPLPALPATAPQELKQLRKTYDESMAGILKTHASSVAELAAKLAEALKAREVQWTKAGKIDLALEAKELRETIEEEEGLAGGKGELSKEAAAKKGWVSLLDSKWEVELSESWYVGDALGLHGKGNYLETAKTAMAEVPDGGFPHFVGVPKASVVFKLRTKVTRFEAKVGMLSFGDGSLILFAGDKKVGEVRVDSQKTKEAVLKAEFEATNRLTLEFDPQGDSAGDWIGVFSPKIR